MFLARHRSTYRYTNSKISYFIAISKNISRNKLEIYYRLIDSKFKIIVCKQ